MERQFVRFLMLLVTLIQSCGGGGGSASSSSQSSLAPTPLTVDSSSFVNKGAADLANFLVPNLTRIAGTNGYASIPETLAVADFQRSGQYSAFVVGVKTVGGSTQTRGFFLKYDASLNSWSDVSDQLFDPTADRASCDDPRLGLVTKINADDRPDVYVVCAGGGGAGVKQQLYISSGNGGKYLRQETLFQVDATSASIADINTDQYADVVTNHGNDLYRVLGGSTTPIWQASKTQIVVTFSALPSFIQSVYLIPRNAERYLLVTGYGSSPSVPPNQHTVSWYLSDNTGAFDSSKSRIFNIASLTSDIYQFDYVERQQPPVNFGYLYAFTRSGTSNTYKKLIRIEAPLADSSGPLASTAFWLYTGVVPSATAWPSRVAIKSGLMVPYDAGCLSNPVLVSDGRCGLSFVDNWSNFN